MFGHRAEDLDGGPALDSDADGADGADEGSPSPDEVLAPGSTAETIVAALAEAGPEAAEHLLAAAQELLLAAKAVVDAAERALESRQQQQQRAPESGAPPSNVRRIDLA